MSCQGSEQSTSLEEIQTVELDISTIESLIKEFDPMFENVNARKEGPELISYELVADLESGAITLLNFQEESFFPIADSSSYARTATVYTVECTKGDETVWTKECDSKWSCGTAINDCLKIGGCASICENPNGFSTIRTLDINFLKSYSVRDGYINSLVSLPQINLFRARQLGTLSSIKLYKLVY